MSAEDLKALEREVWRKFYDDGLFDVFLGLSLATMGISSAIDSFGLSEIVSLAVIVAIYSVITGGMIFLRRSIVLPRLGSFRPSPTRKRRIHGARLVLAGSVLLGLVAFAVPALGSPPAGLMGWIPLIFLVNCVVVFGAMAYFLDVPRFFVYGFLFPAPLIAGYWLPPYDAATSIIAFALPASVIVVAGLYKLAHFLRDYPVRSTEVPSVS